MKEPKEYALYDDDTFIMIGTIKEIAEELGIKEKSVRYLSYPSARGKTKKILNEV